MPRTLPGGTVNEGKHRICDICSIKIQVENGYFVSDSATSDNDLCKDWHASLIAEYKLKQELQTKIDALKKDAKEEVKIQVKEED